MESEENNGFGALLKQRGSWFAKLAAFIVIIIVGVLVFWWEFTHTEATVQFYFDSLVLSLLAWIIGQVIRRACVFAEESRHRHSRYEGSWKKTFTAVFDCKNVEFVVLFVIIVVVLSVYCLYSKQNAPDPSNLRLFLLNSIFLPALLFLSGIHEQLSKIEHAHINEKENKNLADGLAWSYYFGYLRFVLPSLDKQISLTERFRGLKVRKLFILIPKNCVISEKHHISNTSNDPRGLIRFEGNLEALKKSRGGILDREYKNAVHSITDGVTGETHLCILEYATPIMTLHEMSDDPVAGLSREEKDIQVKLFVSKLREILDAREECKGKYEIITFAGGNQDIADIMIRALKDSALEI